MTKDLNVRGFISTLRARFPHTATAADKLLVLRGFDLEHEAIVLWLEAMAMVSNKLMDDGEIESLRALFYFFSESYERGTINIKDLIDVGYVENLFWRTSEQACQHGWKILPANLKQLYLNFHGRAPV